MCTCGQHCLQTKPHILWHGQVALGEVVVAVVEAELPARTFNRSGTGPHAPSSVRHTVESGSRIELGIELGRNFRRISTTDSTETQNKDLSTVFG
jgi:hypothetical protein